MHAKQLQGRVVALAEGRETKGKGRERGGLIGQSFAWHTGACVAHTFWCGS
jgi:hypothetical protein